MGHYSLLTKDKKNLGQFSAGGRIINDLSFTSSAEQIIVRINVSAHSESIISFELPNGSILTRHDFSTMICNPTGCNGVGYQPLSISGDKKYLAVITNEFKVNVIRIEDWEIENTIVVAPGPEAANEGIITLSQEGNILATNFNDGQVRLWDVTNGTLLGTINVYPALKDVFSPEVAMSFSPDGRLLAVSGLGIIHLYGVVP
jgi:WD40 repeat protein